MNNVFHTIQLNKSDLSSTAAAYLCRQEGDDAMIWSFACIKSAVMNWSISMEK